MALPLLAVIDNTVEMSSLIFVDDITEDADNFHIGLCNVVCSEFGIHEFLVIFE